ncbi:MAG: hypothetical protein ABIH99_05325 [Candidatus Micrarchaeota archaeon]
MSDLFCKKCGASIPSEHAVVCLKCGARVEGGSAVSQGKDPGIAALISIVCMFVLGAPSLGYIYLGNVKKGIIYLVANWVLTFGIVIIYFIAVFTVIGAVLCLPIFLIPIILNLLIVYDVHLEASGKKTILPGF